MLFSSRAWQVFRRVLPQPAPDPGRRTAVLIHGMNYAPEMIGVGKYTTELAAFLAGRGHAVEVVAALPHYPAWRVAATEPRRWSVRQEGSIRVTRCPLLARPGRIWRLIAPLSFAALAMPVVIWRALQSRPRTILCVEPTLFAAPAALFAAWLIGAYTVLHVQDLESEAAFATGYLQNARLLLWAARSFERYVRRQFDAVVTISDAMAARLRPQTAPRSPTVLRNWIHLDQTAATSSREAMRARLAVPADCRLVLYSGNLGAKQGLPVLIEAARHLRARPDIRFLIVGDGVMAGRLRAAAAGLPNVTISGLLPAEHLGSLLAAADLHVVPQEKAASDLVFPSKLGPLLQSGRPILVTAEACSELATWLGSSALRCPPGDGRALAAAIGEALRREIVPDPQQAASLLAELDATLVLPAFERCLLPPRSLDAPVRTDPQLDPAIAPAALG